jgi:hypothetical protein
VSLDDLPLPNINEFNDIVLPLSTTAARGSTSAIRPSLPRNQWYYLYDKKPRKQGATYRFIRNHVVRVNVLFYLLHCYAAVIHRGRVVAVLESGQRLVIGQCLQCWHCLLLLWSMLLLCIPLNHWPWIAFKFSANVGYGNGMRDKFWRCQRMEYDCMVRRQQLRFALFCIFCIFLFFSCLFVYDDSMIIIKGTLKQNEQ